MAQFKPYVPADSTEPEFTLKAIVAGILMAALFGASNAYLGMKAGQTVAATIPAAVGSTSSSGVTPVCSRLFPSLITRSASVIDAPKKTTEPSPIL